MLIDRIKEDMTAALRAGNRFKLFTLRLLISELEKEKVALKLTSVGDLTNAQVEAVINRSVKKLDKEKEAYLKAGALTNTQDEEKAILLTYLPRQMTEAEIRHAVAHIVSTNKEFGLGFAAVMAAVSATLKGKADMSIASRIAKESFDRE